MVLGKEREMKSSSISYYSRPCPWDLFRVLFYLSMSVSSQKGLASRQPVSLRQGL